MYLSTKNLRWSLVRRKCGNIVVLGLPLLCRSHRLKNILLASCLLFLFSTQAWAVFPTTAVLDNFNRSDANPMTGWTDIAGGFGANGTVAIGSAASWNISYWNASTYADCEAYATVAHGASTMYVVCRMAADASTSYFHKSDGSTSILGYEDGTGDHTLASYSQSVSDGDSLGISAIGSTISAYYKASGGNWVLLGSVTDTKYSSGYIALIDTGTVSTFDNFGGGAVVTTTYIGRSIGVGIGEGIF